MFAETYPIASISKVDITLSVVELIFTFVQIFTTTFQYQLIGIKPDPNSTMYG